MVLAWSFFCGHSQMTGAGLSKDSRELSTEDSFLTAPVRCLTKVDAEQVSLCLLLVHLGFLAVWWSLHCQIFLHDSWFLQDHVFQETKAEAASFLTT